MKAIALISGGLDSTLAAKLMQGLGLELVCFNTISPFCLCNRTSSNGCLHGASSVAKDLGLKLVRANVTDELLTIVKKPKHGYGSNMNPCIDCRILLFKKAKEYMLAEGASFIITGEVLGQRPMSQKRHTMKLIDREAGLEGLVLRPLSAGVLEPSIPEINGWVDRERLLRINGRGRKEQFAMAKQFGINDFPCPSGGCLLTDPGFSQRLREAIKHNEFSVKNIELLKAGRHFRISPEAKLAVGRDEPENARLEALAEEGDYLFYPKDTLGPAGLGRGIFNEDMLITSCRIIARYCDRDGNPEAEISLRKIPGVSGRSIRAGALSEAQLQGLRI